MNFIKVEARKYHCLKRNLKIETNVSLNVYYAFLVE